MSEELKPCPFCGEAVSLVGMEVEAAMFGALSWFIECKQCDQKFGGYYNRGQTIAAWNRRKP